MKKTLTIVGERTWTGPLENYEVHKECVEHWCNGGEVEWEIHGRWDALNSSNVVGFHSDHNYRIKPREPKNGEVWTVGGSACIYSTFADDDFPFLRLEGGNSYCFEEGPVYAAPSVEAYIAKQLLDQVIHVDSAYEILRRAANV